MGNPLALRRLKRELDELKRNPPVDLSVGPKNDIDFYTWEGILNGPENSPYAGGIFKFEIHFSDDYPMRPPVIRFITRIFHPNISLNGDICVDILKKKWSSVYTVSKVMLSISSLLTDPNPDSALNGESARLYKFDRMSYNKTVKQWVKMYARPENL